MAIEISQVPVAEIDVVVALHAEIFAEPWDEPWSREFLGRILSTPGALAFVAREATAKPATPVGFALIRVSGEECEILSIGVAPGARRRGVGVALLNSANRHAVGLSATSVVLEVAEDNAPAISLYCSRGFAAVGRRRKYYRRDDNYVDALILRREAAMTGRARH